MAYATVLLPFLLLLVSNLLPRRVRYEAAYWGALVVALGQVAIAVRFLFIVGRDPLTDWFERFLGFGFSIDRMSVLVLLTAGIVFAAVLLLGREPLGAGREFAANGIAERRRTVFINLLLINLCGVNGISMIADVFTLYVFIEVVAISSYVLVTLAAGDAYEGSFKYLIVSGIASVLMLTSVGLFILTAGDTSFAAVEAAMRSSAPAGHVAVVLFVAGLFVKGGFFPFHFWVPDAYGAAPTSIAVLLSGIGTKATGTFALLRIAGTAAGFAPAYREVLLIVGIVSAFAGAIAALGQPDMKRMLSYSSVSQVGYIILGLGAGNPIGFVGAAFHFFNHAVSSAQLFGNVAAIEERTEASGVCRVAGVTERMPVTGVTAGIAALSTAGLPPLAGFWSKLFILVGLWQAGYIAYAVLALLATIITLAYFIDWQRVHFLGRAPGGAPLREAQARFTIPALVLAGITLVAGIVFPFVAGLFVR